MDIRSDFNYHIAHATKALKAFLEDYEKQLSELEKACDKAYAEMLEWEKAYDNLSTESVGKELDKAYALNETLKRAYDNMLDDFAEFQSWEKALDEMYIERS